MSVHRNDITPAIVSREPRYVQEVQHSLRAGSYPDHEPEPQPVWDLDGVHWADAEPPPRRHDHWAQTVGNIDGMGEVWRCPCSAYGDPFGPWMHLSHQPVRSRLRWWQR